MRGFAERYWAVTAERPLERRPGLKGALSLPLKRLLRPFMRWYVEPLAYEQRMFNDAALKLIDALYEEIDRGDKADAGLDARIDVQAPAASTRPRYALSERVDEEAASLEQAARLLGEVEERLTRAERRTDGGAPRTVAPQPAATAFPDYFAFESKMRGRTESVQERQRVYVDDFRDAAPVLDVGCGRGELLALLKDAESRRAVSTRTATWSHSRAATGWTSSKQMRSRIWSRSRTARLAGIFMGQVVEHLPPAMLVRTLELAAQKLREGGLLIAETINPLSPLALRNYFADLTHAQPLVPETLAVLARQVGFSQVETRFLNPPDRVEGVAPEVADILFAPLDYAIIARK